MFFTKTWKHWYPNNLHVGFMAVWRVTRDAWRVTRNGHALARSMMSWQAEFMPVTSVMEGDLGKSFRLLSSYQATVHKETSLSLDSLDLWRQLYPASNRLQSLCCHALCAGALTDQDLVPRSWSHLFFPSRTSRRTFWSAVSGQCRRSSHIR